MKQMTKLERARLESSRYGRNFPCNAFLEYYKEMVTKLLWKRDLETLLFFRIATETGIRSSDIIKINRDCMWGRSVYLAEGKTGRIYRRLKGKLPKVSRYTLRIMKLLEQKQGQLFISPREVYIRRTRRLYGKQYFNIHDSRRYRMYMEMLLYRKTKD